MTDRTTSLKTPVDVLLVCSTGGHLLQLFALQEAWLHRSRVWVTFDKSDAQSLLESEQAFYAYGPTNRSLANLVRNIFLAIILVPRLRPRVMITTGAGVAVPFAWVARLVGARVVYIESLSRIDKPSLSCRMIAPVASRIYAQWPDLAITMPRARHLGTIFDR